jgi:hypothetical protein
MDMGKKQTINKIDRALIAEAQKMLDEARVLLQPCFEMLIQPELWTEDIGEDSMEFLILSHEGAAGFPEMFPDLPGVNVFNEEFLTVRELWFFARDLDTLKDRIRGMVRLTGSRALETARAFYKTLKIAARRDLPGARVLFKELNSVCPAEKRRSLKHRMNNRQMGRTIFDNFP